MTGGAHGRLRARERRRRSVRDAEAAQCKGGLQAVVAVAAPAGLQRRVPPSPGAVQPTRAPVPTPRPGPVGLDNILLAAGAQAPPRPLTASCGTPGHRHAL